MSAVVERFAPGRTITGETTIDELGLSSLERVELMMALEEALQVTVDEAKFAAATTVADLEALARPLDATPGGRVGGSSRADRLPVLEPIAPARALRRASLPTWILPLGRVFARVEVEGLEHLREPHGAGDLRRQPPEPLRHARDPDALPARWRYRLAPAMAKEFFKAHFYPEQFSRKAYVTNSLNYYLASLFFNAFPLPQREAGTRQTLRYIGRCCRRASRS